MDNRRKTARKYQFLSTPSARRATIPVRRTVWLLNDFYPRPPRGGRLAAGGYYMPDVAISIHALREEGDQPVIEDNGRDRHISIHALREEGDGQRGQARRGHEEFLSTPSARRATCEMSTLFYPRPPRGGRQQKQRENTLLLSHYTPLCTNCKEMLANQTAKSHRYLRKRLVFRCEASRKTMCAADSHWPDIKRSARCLGQILGAVQRARPWSGSCCLAGRTADCPRQGRSGRSALL